MSGLLAILFGALLAADLDLTAQVTGRHGSAGPAVDAPSISTGQLNGGAALVLDESALRLTAGYSAQGLFNLAEGSSNVDAEAVQIGRLLAEYRFSRQQILRLEEVFDYGVQYFNTLGVPIPGQFATGVPGTVPTVLDPRLAVLERLAYISSRTSASFDQAVSSQLKLGFKAGYIVSGGADDIARATLPLQHGIDASATLLWTLPPSDRLALGVNTAVSRFTNGQENSMVTMDFDWQKDLSRWTRTDVTLGGGVARSRCFSSTECPATAVESTSSEWTPAMRASASVTREIPLRKQRLSGTLRAGVQTTMDPRGGGIYHLAEGQASATWQPTRELQLGAATGIGRPLNGPLDRQALVTWADLSAGLSPARDLQFTLAARTLWQQNPVVNVTDPTAPHVLSKPWAGYASLDLGFSYALLRDLLVSLGGRTLWQQTSVPVGPILTDQVSGTQWSAFASIGYTHHEKF